MTKPTEIDVGNVIDRVLSDPRIASFPWMRDLLAEKTTLSVVQAQHNAWTWLAKRLWSRLTPERLAEIETQPRWKIVKRTGGPLRHSSARVHKDHVELIAAKMQTIHGNMCIARSGNDVLLTVFW